MSGWNVFAILGDFREAHEHISARDAVLEKSDAPIVDGLEPKFWANVGDNNTRQRNMIIYDGSAYMQSGVETSRQKGNVPRDLRGTINGCTPKSLPSMINFACTMAWVLARPNPPTHHLALLNVGEFNSNS